MCSSCGSFFNDQEEGKVMRVGASEPAGERHIWESTERSVRVFDLRSQFVTFGCDFFRRSSLTVHGNSGNETRSLPRLTRSYPRRFTFHVADPIISIQ
jgi:hypothetical protein